MSQRMDRVAEAMREIIATEITRLTDPRIESVTITGVDVSGDFSVATVYFDLLGDEERREQARAGLESARGRLQAGVNDGLHIRRTPRLRFEVDPGILHGEAIDNALAAIEVPPAEGGGDEDVRDE
ncbi:MAG: 30S ribosome-binding factor RbfA [Acidimicrobiia bacterium]|nr:30S ribosome-binding factor RbfA [Acidimicrobiia bacterium]